MLEIQRKRTITHRWWRLDNKAHIKPEHIKALDEHADAWITAAITQGYKSGELNASIHLSDDQKTWVDYTGWWELSDIQTV